MATETTISALPPSTIVGGEQVPMDQGADTVRCPIGTMAAQQDDAVDINGGAIDATTIGATTPAAITGTAIKATTSSTPNANDGATLGTALLRWSDGYFATGAVIDIGGDWIATHTAGVLTIGTGDLRVTTAGTNSASVVTVGGTQTLTAKTFVAPALGTPASGTLTNCTGLPVSTGISGLAAGIATFLATPSSANLATAVTDETGSGALVFATSPTLVTPALGTPASGTLTNCTGLPVATGISGLGTGVATFLATPSSANLAAAVTGETGSGALVFATSPTLVTPALGTPASGTLTSCTGLPVSTGISGLGTGVATFLATPSSANLAAAVTDETGSGALVFATSPTLVTPLLGTPTSGTLTNCTGLPVSTGISGLGTNVAAFLATPSSANLAAALTDETGSGANVFATSPTLVTPLLGTPTSGTLTNCTGLPVSTGVSGLGTGVATMLASATGAVATITFIFDGGGAAITTGVKGDLEVPFACTITRATMLADQSGSIVVDIWKDTYANYPPTVADTITASAKPTISATTKSQDATLTGWTTSIAAGDTLRFNVDSASTVTRVTLSLRITKT